MPVVTGRRQRLTRLLSLRIAVATDRLPQPFCSRLVFGASIDAVRAAEFES